MKEEDRRGEGRREEDRRKEKDLRTSRSPSRGQDRIGEDRRVEGAGCTKASQPASQPARLPSEPELMEFMTAR